MHFDAMKSRKFFWSLATAIVGCTSIHCSAMEYEWRIVNDVGATGRTFSSDGRNQARPIQIGQAWRVSKKQNNAMEMDGETWLLVVESARTVTDEVSGKEVTEELENFWIPKRFLTSQAEFHAVTGHWPIKFLAISVGDWCQKYSFDQNGHARVVDCGGVGDREIGTGHVFTSGLLVQVRPYQGFRGAFVFNPAAKELAFRSLTPAPEIAQRRFGEPSAPLYVGEGTNMVCVYECETGSARPKSRAKSAEKK